MESRRAMFIALDALVRWEKELSFKLSRRCPKDVRNLFERDLMEVREAIGVIAVQVGVTRERDDTWFFDAEEV